MGSVRSKGAQLANLLRTCRVLLGSLATLACVVVACESDEGGNGQAGGAGGTASGSSGKAAGGSASPGGEGNTTNGGTPSAGAPSGGTPSGGGGEAGSTVAGGTSGSAGAGAGGGGASGSDAGGAPGVGDCPAQAPADGEPCPSEGERSSCSYGEGALCYCAGRFGSEWDCEGCPFGGPSEGADCAGFEGMTCVSCDCPDEANPNWNCGGPPI